jgi:hypothetical protein
MCPRMSDMTTAAAQRKQGKMNNAFPVIQSTSRDSSRDTTGRPSTTRAHPPARSPKDVSAGICRCLGRIAEQRWDNGQTHARTLATRTTCRSL